MQALFHSRVYDSLMEDRVNPQRGKKLRAIRKAAGISQREFARQLGTHHSNVGFWERTGTVPRASLIPQMAEILGVSVEDIIGTDERPKRRTKPGGKLGRVFEEVADLPRRQQERIIAVVEDMLVARKAKDS